MSSDFTQIGKLAGDLGNARAHVTVAVTHALDKAAASVQRTAQMRAPVDTGNLRNSIGVARTGATSREIGPTANYGVFVEFGTSRMGPQPFMGPALESVRPSFEQAMAEIGIDLK